MKIMLAYLESFVDMSGGIEHVCCNMANEFYKRGNEVSIVYCGQCNNKPFYPLAEKVKLFNVMGLNPKKWRGKEFSQCVHGGKKVIREIIRVFNANMARDWNENIKGKMITDEIHQAMRTLNPDIIISFRYETSNYLINYAHVNRPVITMFHMDPAVVLPGSPKGEIRAIQKSAAAQVLLKHDISVVEKYCSGANVYQIPNAVPQYEKQADLKALKKEYKIINVARLNKTQKRQHLLVEAFARIAMQFPDWKVELWGGGDNSKIKYEKELKSLIEKYHLERQVFLKGETDSIISQYINSDIFCFPSAYEGFPLAMTEAMSAGLPVVAYKSCSAVSELVDADKDGILSEDGIDALSLALKTLMGNREMRIRMGCEAHEKMKQFDAKNIWDQWELLIKKVIQDCCN